MDLAEGVEPMIHQKSAKFPKKIIIQKVKKVIKKAQKNTFNLALWSGGSKAKSEAGAAIVWKNASTYRWNIRKISLGNNKETYDAEMWGISEALKIALKENISKKMCRVIVFLDSLGLSNGF